VICFDTVSGSSGRASGLHTFLVLGYLRSLGNDSVNKIKVPPVIPGMQIHSISSYGNKVNNNVEEYLAKLQVRA